MFERFICRCWDNKENKYFMEDLIFENTASCYCDIYLKTSDWDDYIITYIENHPDRYVIEQCTGLKDKEGRLIFEGDILSDYQVVYYDSTGFFGVSGEPVGRFLKEHEDILVIGNIHEGVKSNA